MALLATHNLQPYNPRRHITARQLRDMGFLLPEYLPDEAFVRRVAVGLDDREDLDDGTAMLGLKVLEPFAVEPELAVA